MDVENSTFLIKSTKNKGFGTAFCIDKDDYGSFFLTCKHVVKLCGKEYLEISQLKAEVQKNISTNNLIDLAVIYVKGLYVKPLKLSLHPVERNMLFSINGFKRHTSDNQKGETLNGRIKKISKIYNNSNNIDTYELSIGENDFIEKGYSGSAIVSKQSGQVVAVATERTGTGKQAYAIPLKYLQEIWSELDQNLFNTITPFVGLSAFGRKDSSYFFGRDRETDDILKKMETELLIAIVGDSGSGKSSLVKAGVIPKFLENLKEKNTYVIEIRPASNPFEELAFSISRVCKKLGYSEADIGYFRKEIESQNPKNIQGVFMQLFKEDKSYLLFYIDQFEELFTLGNEVLEKKFIALLLFLKKNQNHHLKVNILFSMRRDYYNVLSSYEEFYTDIEMTKYLLKRMNDENLKDVIEKPLELLNVLQSEITKLSRVILKDMGDESKEITLLQITLTEVWTNRTKYNYDLLETYIAIGTVTGALSKLATNIQSSLTIEEEKLFKYILIRLVKFNDIGGISRRLAERSEFSDEAWKLVQRLASNHEDGSSFGRLITLKSFREEEKEEFIELIHEALLTQWDTYVKWSRELNRGGKKRIHDTLIDRTKQYVKEGNSKSKFLLRGNVLEESRRLLDKSYITLLSVDERRLINNSIINKRIIRSIGAVFLVLSIAIITYLYGKIIISEKNRIENLNSNIDGIIIGFNDKNEYKVAQNKLDEIIDDSKNLESIDGLKIISKAYFGKAFLTQKKYDKNKSKILNTKLIDDYTTFISEAEKYYSEDKEMSEYLVYTLYTKAKLLEEKDKIESIKTYYILIDKFKNNKDKNIIKYVKNTYGIWSWLNLEEGNYTALIAEKKALKKNKDSKASLAHAYLCLSDEKSALELYMDINDVKYILDDFKSFKDFKNCDNGMLYLSEITRKLEKNN